MLAGNTVETVSVPRTLFRMGGGRSLTPVESQHVRKLLKQLVAQYGTQTSLAPVLKMRQQSLSAVLSGRAAGSYSLARKVAGALKITVDEALGVDSTAGVRFGSMPQWQEASAEARRLFRDRLPKLAFDLADDLRNARPPSRIDAGTVYVYARACWDGLSDEDQAEANRLEGLAKQGEPGYVKSPKKAAS